MAKLKLKETIAQVRAREQEEGRLSVKEYISYAVSQFGFGSLGVMSGGYLMQFYASIGINIKTAGSILTGMRMWDWINDPIVATVIDKGKTGPDRRGKFSRFMAPLVPFFTIICILMFINPPLHSMGGKIAFFILCGVVWETLNTFTGISFQSMQAVMSPLLEERSSYITFGNLGGKLTGALPGLIPVALEFLARDGANRGAYMKESKIGRASCRERV